nr:protein kinase regulator [Cryptococcus depauperatus CBS 7855]
MDISSPKTASPPMSLLEWDEDAVVSFLKSLELGMYEDAIYEHVITGDVLSALDHEALQELGISSIGQRLSLLRAVYEIKMEQGIELGDDDWKPPYGPDRRQAEVDRLTGLVREQHERLLLIERDYSRLTSTLKEKGIAVVETEDDGTLTVEQARRMAEAGRFGNTKWKEPKDDEKVVSNYLCKYAVLTCQKTKAKPRPDHLSSSSLVSSINTSAPLSSNSATFQDSFTPTTSNPHYVDSPTPSGIEKSRPAPLNRLLSENALPSGSSSPSMTPPLGTSQSMSASSIKTSTSFTPGSSSASAPEPSSSTKDPSDKEKSRAKDAARSAAKSFRVTLEDPCWKVLPAALKKYKINDDWRLYVLFICYDSSGESTDRCLSYDEKPLLLFQKLKETGHKPVFMLRHIKDIRSPVHVAQTKQAQKMNLPANTSTSLLPKLRSANDTSASPTKATHLKPAISRNEEGQTPSGTAFPELPSPGLRDGDGSQSAGGNRQMGQLIDPDGTVITVSYGVAIYPYCRDREDEFDVAVGSTYIIRSKNKGWYIVNKDPDATGLPINYDQGWVPAGCLLELNQPMSIISPTTDGQITTYPGLAPLLPQHIISSSYAGFVMMDYEAKGDDELSLEEGERVRVYKKYCHWYVLIRNETGERGWVPAWFVGKTPNTISVGMRDTEAVSKPKAIASSSVNGSAPADHMEEERPKEENI